MATIESREVRYSAGGVDMVGYLAWDAAVAGPRPGVIVVHEWWGANDYVQRRADRLAELGYAGFAVDLYGDGRVAADPDEAGALMNGLLGDLPVLRDRFRAALDRLRVDPVVDGSKTAAIGYCMGGGIVLHMACHGAGLAAVGSFHGALPLATAGLDEVVRPTARLAVYHGEADEFVTMDDARAFRAALDAAGADLMFVLLPGATHGFSNPLATERGEKYGLPLRYSALADSASWDHMQLVLRDALA
ncbi:MAG: dienelactone hydrolase family protein [Xanthomonadales bacterium]